MKIILYHKEYVANYTNATFIVKDGFTILMMVCSVAITNKTRTMIKQNGHWKTDEDGKVIKDPTLEDPRCVFQLMKKHYARYDVDTVVGITGTPKEDLFKGL